MIELEHADGDSFEPIPTPEIEPDAGIVAGEEAAFRLRLLETKIYRSHLRSLRNSWCLFAALKLAADTWRAVHGAAALSSRHPRIYRPLCGAPHNAEFELLSGRAPEGSDRAKARGVEMGRKPKLTPHQQREAIKRRDVEGEPIREIARSYNLHNSTDFTVRNLRMRASVVLLALLAYTLTTPNGMAMDFQLVDDHTIYATGAINEGDAAKLTQFLHDKALDVPDVPDSEKDYTVRLNSLGGLLQEGMKIGDIIRNAALDTLISRRDVCASACALAFLGGTRRYVTGTGIGRRMEFGASLGFHGFSVAATDSIRLENETLNSSRVIAALILQYAAKLKSLDLGWLAQTLNVSPNELFYVRTPADIAALSIAVEGMRASPRDWYLNICRRVVNDLRPALDSAWAGERVSDSSNPIPTIKALRKEIVSGRFAPGPVATFVARLSDSDAIDLAFSEPFYLDRRKPILEARSVDLERGAGFYYDECIAVRSKDEVSVILVDQVSKGLYRKDFAKGETGDFGLAMFDEKTPLW